MLDEQSGETTSGRLLTHHHRTGKSKVGTFDIRDRTGEECDWGGDTGGVSRFFYTAKATRAERGEGNNHPTVKPLDLMRWLVRLVTPTGGIVLDPFSGSGTTGCAARLEGFRFVGFDTDEHYCEIANARIAATGERLGEVRPETAKIAQQVGMFTASGYVSPATRRSISSVHFQQQRGVTREDTRGSRVVSFARRGRVVGSGR